MRVTKRDSTVKENSYNHNLKELISSPNHPSPMDEEINWGPVQEFGPNFVRGMPADQRIKMVPLVFKHITIWEEYEPKGTQHLRAEDILDELRYIPNCIINYISSIVLSPFDCDSNDYWRKRTGDKGLVGIANPDPHTKQITIYAIPESRNILKQYLKDNLTIQHEVGHIIDFLTPSHGKFLSEGVDWSSAMLKDMEVKPVEKMKHALPTYYVSDDAKELDTNPEDFAESVAIYSVKNYRMRFRKCYPNRCEILKRLLNAH